MANPHPQQQQGGGEGMQPETPCGQDKGDGLAAEDRATTTATANGTSENGGYDESIPSGGSGFGGALNNTEVAEGERETFDHDDQDQLLSPLPPYLQGPLDPARMELTEEEREWALEVKDSLEGLPDLDTISDFMIVQLALVEWESRSMENVIENAYNWQQYREEYQILESFNDAKRFVQFYIRRHPGYVLHFGRMEGRYAVVHDMTKFDIDVLKEIDGLKNMMKSAYYFHHAFNPDVAAVREGVLFMMECEGFLWKAPRMVNSEVWRIGWEDAAGNYPYHLYQFRFCNAGVIVNTHGLYDQALHTR